VEDGLLSHIRRFDHVGITVADEGSWRMAYVRGPEGIIVSLAERIG
jgi:hypothetical protein